MGDKSLPQHDGAVGERVDRTQHTERAEGNGHLGVGTGELFGSGRGRAGAWLDWDGCAYPDGVNCVFVVLLPAQLLLALARRVRTSSEEAGQG